MRVTVFRQRVEVASTLALSTLVTRRRRVAARSKATPSQIALAWLLARSPVILPIPGTSSVKHLEENVAAAGLRMNESTMQELGEMAHAS